MTGWKDPLIFLFAAGVLVPLLARFRIAPVLGYLLIGVLLGPHGLGEWVADVPALAYVTLTESEAVHTFAELGVIFLLFMIGLDLSLERLWAMRRQVFGLGSLQVVLTAIVIAAIARSFGNSVDASVILGACLALSSTAIVMQVLVERQQVGTPLGQSSFAVLLMQDLAVVPILFMVGIMAAPGEGSVGFDLLRSLAQAVAVVAAIYLLGRRLLHPVFRMVAASRNIEMFTALTLLMVVMGALLTGAFGLSMALGAFLVGLLLAETEFRHEIEVTIEPFKGLLLGVFFMSVGMGIDLGVLERDLFWIIASVAGLFLIKALILMGLGVVFRLPVPVAIETGLLLGQGGEFAFVVVGLSLAAGILPEATAQFMLLVVGLSMMMTPLVASVSRAGLQWLESRGIFRKLANPEGLEEVSGHVVIAGFGRIGRTLVRLLDSERVPYLAIDRHAADVDKYHRLGLPVYYGDAARVELLKKLGIEQARALVITMDNPSAAERVVSSVRAQWPHLFILARARDVAHATRLLQLGANEVVPETVEASLQMATRVLESIGVPEDVARRHADAERHWQLNAMSLHAAHIRHETTGPTSRHK
jgi:CPA2 family monovalent cation:H+ antiporter-2